MMFVIMRSVGQYSDRVVDVLGYNSNEDRTKELVMELVKADQHTKAVDRTKSDLWGKAYSIWKESNPYPIFGEERPRFDQSKHGNKTYIAEHTERKHQFIARERQFHVDYVEPYMRKQNEFTTAYVEEHFDENNLVAFEWTDTQFWYETVEEML